MNKNLLRLGLILLSFIFLAAIGGVTTAHAQPVDHSLWAELLKAHVKEGVVNYLAFKNDEKKLDRYLGYLETIDPETLTREAQFAFYINVYNAWTVKLILTEYPGIDSIKDIGGFFSSPWKKKIVRLNGKILTLDNVEHDILRPRFKDPRVHFAVNCASIGCPPLWPEPYRGEILDRQLDEATEAFINNPERNRLEGDTLNVSKIFKWFKEDFSSNIVGFIQRYAKGSFKTTLEQKASSVDIEYLDYDWGLNGH